jgi:hypothetical protein
VNVQIAPNNKMAFYIHSNGGVDYTNGVGITVPDTIFSQDNFIRFREGTGKASIFSANFNPRVFNGRINYCYLESWIGIEENQSLDGLNIWPNPNDGIFNLSMANSNEVFERVEIMNLEGKIIRQEQIVSSTLLSFDISGQPAGLYFVKVYTDKGTYSKKIVLTGN